MRRLLTAILLCVPMLASGQFAPVFYDGTNFTCTSGGSPSNANTTYCDNNDISYRLVNLQNLEYNGSPCYTYPQVVETDLYWVYDWYNGGIYWMSHDLNLFGLDTNSGATYPSAYCPWALTETYPPGPGNTVTEEFVGYVTQVNGNLNCQGGAGHVVNSGYPYTGSIFQCACPPGQAWDGFWGTIPSGICAAIQIPFNTGLVIDPPCNSSPRGGGTSLNDHRTFSVPAGQKFALDIVTAVGGTNFIPDPSTFVRDGKGRQMPFANGFKQFNRILDRRTGSWLMYATFQMPTDVNTGQFFLVGGSCVGPVVNGHIEVEYSVQTYPEQ